jgi:hypothetical protein
MIGEVRAGLTPGIRAVRGPSVRPEQYSRRLRAGGDDNGPNVCNAVGKEDDVLSDI